MRCHSGTTLRLRAEQQFQSDSAFNLQRTTVSLTRTPRKLRRFPEIHRKTAEQASNEESVDQRSGVAISRIAANSIDKLRPNSALPYYQFTSIRLCNRVAKSATAGSAPRT